MTTTAWARNLEALCRVELPHGLLHPIEAPLAAGRNEESGTVCSDRNQ